MNADKGELAAKTLQIEGKQKRDLSGLAIEVETGKCLNCLLNCVGQRIKLGMMFVKKVVDHRFAAATARRYIKGVF